MFLDFAIMSVLLVVAHLLRARIKLLQNLFIPTAIIAGFLGLLGGSQVFNLLPFAPKAVGPDSGVPAMADYPFYLVILLFATLLMGRRKKGPPVVTVARNVGDTFFYNLGSEIGMFGLALLFTVTVLAALFPSLNSDSSSVGGFGLLLPAGFVGGHGTANVVGTVLRDSGGFEEALTVGYTFATVGLLAGILGGMVIINLGTRRGWTRMVRSAEELPESVRRGFLSKDEQLSIGQPDRPRSSQLARGTRLYGVRARLPCQLRHQTTVSR